MGINSIEKYSIDNLSKKIIEINGINNNILNLIEELNQNSKNLLFSKNLKLYFKNNEISSFQIKDYSFFEAIKEVC